MLAQMSLTLISAEANCGVYRLFVNRASYALTFLSEIRDKDDNKLQMLGRQKEGEVKARQDRKDRRDIKWKQRIKDKRRKRDRNREKER